MQWERWVLRVPATSSNSGPEAWSAPAGVTAPESAIGRVSGIVPVMESGRESGKDPELARGQA